MLKIVQLALGLLALASASFAGGGCENPASFKKCLAQTRAEVNICGINMTCKCARQENVVRCYEKCGDDKYYHRLQQGEKGEQQIFCSQKQKGEPKDLPIIGSDHGSDHKKEPSSRPQQQQQQQQKAAGPPPPPPPPLPKNPGRPGMHSDERAMTGATMANFDAAPPGVSANTRLIASIVAVAAALVYST